MTASSGAIWESRRPGRATARTRCGNASALPEGTRDPCWRSRADEGDGAGARADEGVADAQAAADVALGVGEAMRRAGGAEEANRVHGWPLLSAALTACVLLWGNVCHHVERGQPLHPIYAPEGHYRGPPGVFIILKFVHVRV